MKITTEPRSDQWNADDFVSGPRTFTVAGVRTGTAEQKYDILLEAEERVWRPPLTVLRLLVAGWGDDAAAWTGRRITLYRDDSIKFGKDAVGGIRVSHMSHLAKPLRIALTATRGKRAMHVVEPLPDAPAAPKINIEALVENIAEALTADEVKRLGNQAHAAGVLDVEFDGKTIRTHVTDRLADFAAPEADA